MKKLMLPNPLNDTELYRRVVNPDAKRVKKPILEDYIIRKHLQSSLMRSRRKKFIDGVGEWTPMDEFIKILNS